MIWVLVIILFAPDGTWQAWTSEAGPFHTQKECIETGIDTLDGDGDNEHFICAPIEEAGYYRRIG